MCNIVVPQVFERFKWELYRIESKTYVFESIIVLFYPKTIAEWIFFCGNHGKKLVSKYSWVNNKSTRTTSRISYIVLVFPLLTLKKYLPAGIFMMKCQDLVCNLVVSVKSVDTCSTFCYIGERKTGKVPEDATLEKN